MKPTSGYLVFAFLLFLIFVESGCRRGPSTPPPEKYAREIERERQVIVAPSEVYLPDKYPWEGKKPSLENLPTRIDALEKRYIRELDAFEEVMRGSHRSTLH